MSVPHGLPQPEALRRIKEKAAAVLHQHATHLHNLQESWSDYAYAFSFAVMGMAIKGTVVIESAEVKLGAQVPLMALPFRGAIEKQVREELAKVLK
jgi:hypothetical protein